MKSYSADAIFTELDFDPLRTAVELVQHGEVEDRDKLAACVSMAGYRYAKKKELVIDAPNHRDLTREQLLERIREAQAKIAEEDAKADKKGK